MRFLWSIIILSHFLAGSCLAGDVQIVDAKASQRGDNWSFSVTLKHADSGWEHYADAWRVVDDQGEVLGTRTLFHPHENEQPFTRSLDGVRIPDSTKPIYIEAHDKVHGWAAQRFELQLQAQ